METTKTWSTVIDAVVERDPKEGTFSLRIDNADGHTGGTYELDAVTQRAAMSEATMMIKSLGWKPTTRTWMDDGSRRFRRAK